MKTKFLSFIPICIILSGSLSAQDNKFKFGLKVAPTLAWLKTDTKGLDSDGSKIGFAYGVMGEYAFSQNYYLASGIDVTYRGGKTVFNADPITIKDNITLQYIELPVTLKLRTNEIGYLTYYGQFGFAPGVNISARKDEVKNDIEDNDISFKSDIVPVNIALIVGAGVEYSLGGRTAIMVGITFNNGFIDVFEPSDFTANSNFLALNIGVYF